MQFPRNLKWSVFYHLVLLGSSKVETLWNTPILESQIQRTLFGEYFLIEIVQYTDQ